MKRIKVGQRIVIPEDQNQIHLTSFDFETTYFSPNEKTNYESHSFDLIRMTKSINISYVEMSEYLLSNEPSYDPIDWFINSCHYDIDCITDSGYDVYIKPDNIQKIPDNDNGFYRIFYTYYLKSVDVKPIMLVLKGFDDWIDWLINEAQFRINKYIDDLIAQN